MEEKMSKSKVFLFNQKRMNPYQLTRTMMSIESTVNISRARAEKWAVKMLTSQIVRVATLSDDDLEKLIYNMSRETNRFDNFNIVAKEDDLTTNPY